MLDTRRPVHSYVALDAEPSTIEVGFWEGSNVEVAIEERRDRLSREAGANEKKPPAHAEGLKKQSPEGFHRRGCMFTTADCNLGSAEACSKIRQDLAR